MQWDLGLEGLAVLAAMSIGFALVAGLSVGDGLRRRTWATAVTALACFATGLLTSEVFFGWATEEDLQPNVDGLSRDEALLACVLTTAVVVVLWRYLGHRDGAHRGAGGARVRGTHGRPAAHH
jgi:hypothetical protein